MIDHPQDFAETAPAVQQLPLPEVTELPDTIPCDTLDEFVRHLTHWHALGVARVQHLLAVPEGVEFQVGEGDEVESVVLKGDMLLGFKFGLELAMMQLGKLPFVIEVEETTSAQG